MNKFTKDDLKRFRAESLYDKEQRTLANVSEWFNFWNDEVYVAFSGGKDSSVLADICGFWCGAVGATLHLVFVNTGLEYPEIQKHVKSFAEYLRNKYKIEVDLEILRPQMRFDEVIKKYGYPIIGKTVADQVELGSNNLQEGKYSLRLRCLGVMADDAALLGLKMPTPQQLNKYEKAADGSKFENTKYKPLLDVDFRISAKCCDVMKKSPSHEYSERTGRKPIIATMASESLLREKNWLASGCNAFDSEYPSSRPMSFWTEQDVLQYIKKHQIPIASVYGDVEYVDDPEQIRFEDLDCDLIGNEKLHTTGCQRTGCIFCGFGCHREEPPSRFERLKITHPRQYEYCIGGGEYNEDGIWQPSKEGLGMGHVFDVLNSIYGEGFIRY